MSKTRTKCHCGNQYVMVDESKALLGGTISCGAADCTEPIEPGAPESRGQTDLTASPARGRRGTELY